MGNKRRRLSAKERKQVFDMFGGRCAYCGSHIRNLSNMQVDHKKPLSIGGTDTLDNMLPACRSCNHYKHTRGVEEFREYLSGIPKRVRRDSIAFKVGERYGLLQINDVPVKFYFEIIGGKEDGNGKQTAEQDKRAYSGLKKQIYLK